MKIDFKYREVVGIISSREIFIKHYKMEMNTLSVDHSGIHENRILWLDINNLVIILCSHRNTQYCTITTTKVLCIQSFWHMLLLRVLNSRLRRHKFHTQSKIFILCYIYSWSNNRLHSLLWFMFFFLVYIDC